MTTPHFKFTCPICGKPAELLYHVETRTLHKAHYPVFALSADEDEETMLVGWDWANETVETKAETTDDWYSCSACGKTFSDEEELYKLWQDGNLVLGSPHRSAEAAKLHFLYEQCKMRHTNSKSLLVTADGKSVDPVTRHLQEQCNNNGPDQT